MLKAKINSSNARSVIFMGTTLAIPAEANYVFVHSARGKLHVCASVDAPKWDNISWQAPNKATVMELEEGSLTRADIHASLTPVDMLSIPEPKVGSTGSTEYVSPKILSKKERDALNNDGITDLENQSADYIRDSAVADFIDTLEQGLEGYKNKLQHLPAEERWVQVFHPKGLAGQIIKAIAEVGQGSSNLLNFKETGECSCKSCLAEQDISDEIPEELIGALAQVLSQLKP